MNADERRWELDSLTEAVLGAVFEEKVYEGALLRELELRSIPADSQGTFSAERLTEASCPHSASFFADRVDEALRTRIDGVAPGRHRDRDGLPDR